MLPHPINRLLRSLNKKETQLYAPLANIGSVVMDQDAMYIDIGRANYTRKENLLLEDGAGGGAAEAGSGEDGEGSSDDDDDEVRGWDGVGGLGLVMVGRLTLYICCG